jgi:hypothetical protein
MTRELRRFLLVAGGFIALNAIPFIAAELWLRRHSADHFLADRNLRASIAKFELRARSLDVLFLGDSMAHFGIDPDAIPASGLQLHNFAFPGEPPATTFYKVKYYLERGDLPHLRLAVVQLNYYSVTEDYRAGLNTDYDYSRFYEYWDIARHQEHRQTLLAVLGQSTVFRLHTDFVGQIQFRSLDAEPEPTAAGYGSRQDFVQSTDVERQTFEDLRTRLDESYVRVRIGAVENYRRLVNLFRNRGIKVAFLQLPTLAVVRANEPMPENLLDAVLERRTVRLIQHLFPGLPNINTADAGMAWQAEHFADATHLNQAGARLLGEGLAAELPAVLNR